LELFEGQHNRQRLGTYAVLAIATFVLGVIGSGYLRGPEPFPMQQQSSSVSATPLIAPGRTGGVAPSPVPSPAQPTVGQVSINEGSQAELESLPGIGPVIAGRIIEYRNRIGGFKSLEEINAVKGIGNKTYAKILPHIRL
jgi:competence protein ComEA